MKSLLRAVLAVGLVTSGLALLPAPARAAAGQARAGKATPRLLEEAVARGEISQATADLHLAEALAGPSSGAKVPARFLSDTPWDGTLPLRRLRQRLDAQPASPTKARLEALAASTNCDDSVAALPNEATSTHFYVAYDTVGGGLTIASYLTSLEAAYGTEVTAYGWAAPPALASPPPAPIGTKYPVRVDSLSPGLYGFVSTAGTGAGFVGNNPNTSWNDQDAYASCMVLNRDYTGFQGTPQKALDATTAHELNHSIQYGYGVITGGNVPDDSMFEGGSTWMEDEVFDAANDSYGYLWPNFRDSMGEYNSTDPYPFWLVLRGLTERFGTNVAGGGEQVMQDFWELTSKNLGNNLSALGLALQNKGVTLADAYHDFAIGAGFMKSCGGGYALPYCFEEAAGYTAAAGGLPPVAGSIPTVGGSFPSTIEDDYALAWVTLPPAASYRLTLSNTSPGGQLRATAVCDTGTGLVRTPLPAVVGSGGVTTLPSFSSSGCTRTLAVITNQAQSAGNPSAPAARSFTLSTGAVGTVPPPRSGYWMLGSTGSVYGFGDATNRGAPAPIAAANISSTSSGNGYWVVGKGGNVFPYGDAGFFGSRPALRAGETVSTISPTPDGAGYWLFTSQGRVFPFGSARHFGDLSAFTLSGPVLGSAATPSGNGYYMVASDGGIFAFGDAAFRGSMGGRRLSGPVVGLAPDPDGIGYWLVATDGGIFAFDAAFRGSLGGTRLNQPVVGMVAYGDGYLMVAADGGIFSFSSKPFVGSLGNNPPPNPIIAVTALNQ